MDIGISTHYPFKEHALRVWYICQVLIMVFCVTGVELVMMVRGESGSAMNRNGTNLPALPVFAWYHQRRWIGILFCALVFGKVSVVVVSLIVTAPTTNFEPVYLITHTPASFIYFG